MEFVNFRNKKKIISILIVFFCMIGFMLFAILMGFSAGKIRINQHLDVNDKTVSAETFKQAQAKYLKVIFYNILYQNKVPLESSETLEFYDENLKCRLTFYCAQYDSSISTEEYEKSQTNTEYLSYKISSEQGYKNFCKLTHHMSKKQTSSITYPNVVYGCYVTVPTYSYYETYPFYYENISTKLKFFNNNKKTYVIFSTSLVYSESAEELDSPPNIYSEDLSLTNFRMTVSLTESIDVTLHGDDVSEEQENINYFRGIFDGGSHTIHFGGRDKYYPSEMEAYKIEDKYYSPFCSYLDSGGEIKNLRISYVFLHKLLIDDGWTEASYVGGIVGYNKGKVYNCIVRDPKAYSERYLSNAEYAPLVYINASSGTCRYCKVEGSYELSASVDGVDEGIKGYVFSSSYQGLAHCIYSADFENVGKENSSVVGPTSSTSLDSTNGLYFYDREPKTGGFANLNKNNIPGEYETSSYWYYAKGSNGEYYGPVLRSFVSWHYLEITVKNGTITSGGELQDKTSTKVQVPRYAKNIPTDGILNNNKTLVFYEQVVEISSDECNEDGVVRTKTKVDDSGLIDKHYIYKYEITFVKREITVRLNVKEEGVTTSYDFKLECGDTLGLTATKYIDQDNAYRLLEFYKKDRYEESIEPALQKFIYVNDDDIEKWMTEGFHNHDGNDVVITIEIKPKSYNVDLSS